MASTQKVILTVIFLNTLIVLTTSYGINANLQQETGWDEFQRQIASYEERTAEADNLATEDENLFQRLIGSTTDFVEGVFDSVSAFLGFSWILVEGLLPWTVTSGINTAEVPLAERILFGFIIFFRSTLMVMLALELFLLVRNRKTGA